MDLLAGYSSSDDDDEEKEKESTNTSTAPPAPAISQRSKRMISLAAVLPRHIFDQLTESQVKGKNDDNDYDDDSDSDFDDEKARDASKLTAPNTSAPSLSSSSQRDVGLSSLLSALHAAPTNKPIFQPKANTTNTIAMNTISEPLGAAFLATETSVTRRSKQEQSEDTNSMIQDIHQISSIPSSTTPSKPRVSVMAAPRLRNAAPAAAQANDHNIHTAMFPPPPPPPPPPPLSSTAFTTTTFHNSLDENPAANATTRKRSRKELERALRQGQLDHVLEHVTLDASSEQYVNDHTNFMPAPEEQPVYGIKVAPTALYDPSQGAVSVDKRSSGRGKNQIHHVMAAAAQLERQRAREGNKTNSNNTRVNAKQKYGW
jgi:hypothetical protein